MEWTTVDVMKFFCIIVLTIIIEVAVYIGLYLGARALMVRYWDIHRRRCKP